jgi:hypothetical protein
VRLVSVIRSAYMQVSDMYVSLAKNRIAQLEAALREIAVGLTAEDAVAGFSQRYQLCAGRLCKIARDALTASETATEPVMPKYYATCCKCKKVIAVDAPPQGIFYCGYGCT